jgi:hypothetical protein
VVLVQGTSQNHRKGAEYINCQSLYFLNLYYALWLKSLSSQPRFFVYLFSTLRPSELEKP